MADFYVRRTRVKFCGMTRLQDAQNAVQAGADALGFIFFAKSPRNISPEIAAEIVSQLPPFVDCVGVFVDEEIEVVGQIAKSVQLSAIQLHGKETPEYCSQLAKHLPFCKIIKAFRVSSATSANDIDCYNSIDAVLLDTYVKGEEGGTGKIFDWCIIERLQLKKPYILAGGLEPANIVSALDKLQPWALDVNSGVEDTPGVKNHELISKVMGVVREMDRELG